RGIELLTKMVKELKYLSLQGPTFGAMMISGQKAAHLASRALGLPNGGLCRKNSP
ncbi:hypothetical protein L195_g039241, partial [Trifolium pratense]